MVRTCYLGIDIPLAVPGATPEGFAVVDTPIISPTWYGFHYSRGEQGFWFLAGLETAPRAAEWRQVDDAGDLGIVSLAGWGDVTWVRVGDPGTPFYLVGEAGVEAAMIQAASTTRRVER
jgi:hypothetical protein